jgi:hypothetical protein
MIYSILEVSGVVFLVLLVGFIALTIIQRLNMSPDQRRRAREEMHLDDYPFG